MNNSISASGNYSPAVKYNYLHPIWYHKGPLELNRSMFFRFEINVILMLL